MELASLIANVVIAIGTIVAIFAALYSSNKNTRRQIENNNKQSTRPYLSITNCELKSVPIGSLDTLPVEFDDFFKAKINNKLEGRSFVDAQNCIALTFKNNGYGTAKINKMFDINKEFPVILTEQIDKPLIRKDNYYFDVPINEEITLYIFPSYIREKQKIKGLSKPISDMGEFALFYEDLNYNIYSNKFNLKIIYDVELSEKKKEDIYYVEYSQMCVIDHKGYKGYETKDKHSHFSHWLNSRRFK